MPDAKNVFNKILFSHIKADLLILFNKNPRLADRTEGLARRIGRRPAEIGDDLQDLVDIGLLKRRQLRGSEEIRCDPKRAAKVRELLSTYIATVLEE